MYSWTIDVGRSMASAPGQSMSREKYGETLSDPRTPSNALTGQDPEIFRANPEAIEAPGFFNGVHARRHPGCRPNVLQPNTEQSSSMNGCSSVALKSSSPQVRRIMWAGPPSALQFDATKAYTSARWEQVVLE